MSRFDRFRRIPQRHPARTVVALGLALVLAVATILHTMHLAVLEETVALAETLTARTDSAFADVRKLSDGEKRTLRTYLNKQHVARAEALGISGLTTREAALDLAEDDRLVRLETNDLFYVEPMDYSVPYVTASTANLLQRVGLAFQAALRAEGLPPYKFVITSATRSQEDQAALRRVNGNAVPKSSHNFGTTVDIHYRKFFYAPANDVLPPRDDVSVPLLQERLATAYANLGQVHHERLEALLGRVLLDLQQQGDVLVIYERRQPVFHITVGGSVPPPDRPGVAAAPSDTTGPSAGP